MCFQIQKAGRSPREELFPGQDAFHPACGNVCHEALAQGKAISVVQLLLAVLLDGLRAPSADKCKFVIQR